LHESSCESHQSYQRGNISLSHRKFHSFLNKLMPHTEICSGIPKFDGLVQGSALSDVLP
jgi:hypothetical protein